MGHRSTLDHNLSNLGSTGIPDDTHHFQGIRSFDSGEDALRFFYRHSSHVTQTIGTTSFQKALEVVNEIWLQSAQWFQRSCLELQTDGRCTTEPAYTILKFPKVH